MEKEKYGEAGDFVLEEIFLPSLGGREAHLDGYVWIVGNSGIESEKKTYYKVEMRDSSFSTINISKKFGELDAAYSYAAKLLSETMSATELIRRIK